ncbi:MAG TPA: M42 family metallopeptidase [Firmicutes bacterium]|jgi:putative aminopeptidase FrvX|nr:M42 family metallopeptidase [Bacillota bacterium]
MLNLLTALCNAWGPAGAEQQIRALIAGYAQAHSTEVQTDTLGNLIVRQGTPGGKRIMLSAHMDEIGLMVTFIDDDGFLRFTTVGGVSPAVLYGQPVRFADGLTGVVHCEKLNDIKDLKIERMYIDIGAESKAAAEERVAIGDMCCYHQSLRQVGKRVVGKALDDRVGCAVLLSVMQQISQTPYDIYYVFSVQEEVGAHGAKTAAFAIEPHLGLAVDVTGVGDTPNTVPLAMKLGAGAAIKVMDRSVICHPKVRGLLDSTAKDKNIPHQVEVLPYGGTDAGPIHTSRAGVPSGAVSIPTRYVHTPGEMVDLSDVQACIDLLTAFLTTKCSW